jgi:hypothetical protein
MDTIGHFLCCWELHPIHVLCRIAILIERIIRIFLISGGEMKMLKKRQRKVFLIKGIRMKKNTKKSNQQKMIFLW